MYKLIKVYATQQFRSYWLLLSPPLLIAKCYSNWPALSTFEPNLYTCIRLHLLWITSNANELKCNDEFAYTLRACLHGGGWPQIGVVTSGGSPHLSCKRDQIKMRDYVDRRVTQQSGLPHPPGVPHLHVNRPLGPVYMEWGTLV